MYAQVLDLYKSTIVITFRLLEIWVWNCNLLEPIFSFKGQL